MPISIPQKKSTKALIDLGISRFQNFKANLLRFEILNQNGALSDFYNDISMLIFGQCCIHSIRNFYQGFKGNEEKNWKNVKIPTMGVALKFQNFVCWLLAQYTFILRVLVISKFYTCIFCLILNIFYHFTVIL